MGHAMATLFEAKANAASNSPNYICQEAGSFRRTKVAMKIAELCYDTILEYGVAAKIANEPARRYRSLGSSHRGQHFNERPGFQNTACLLRPRCRGRHHRNAKRNQDPPREKVAFGTLCAWVAENAPSEIVEEYITFCMEVGLPTTLEDLQVELTEKNLQLIASTTFPDPTRPRTLRDHRRNAEKHLKAADALGRYYQQTSSAVGRFQAPISPHSELGSTDRWGRVGILSLNRLSPIVLFSIRNSLPKNHYTVPSLLSVAICSRTAAMIIHPFTISCG